MDQEQLYPDSYPSSHWETLARGGRSGCGSRKAEPSPFMPSAARRARRSLVMYDPFGPV